MSKRRIRVLLCVAGVVVGLAVWLGAELQRGSARGAAQDARAAQELLASVLDQEAGVRGYQLTGDGPFLDRRSQERRAFAEAADDLRDAAADDPDVAAALEQTLSAERRWRTTADEAVRDHGQGSFRALVAATHEHERQLDDLRASIEKLQAELTQAGAREDRAAVLKTIALALGAFLLIAVTGLLWLRRRMLADAAELRCEQRYREQQAEFSRALLTTATEDEAHALLKRHLERDAPRTVTVLESSNSHDRLAASTPLPPGDALGEALADAVPRDCVAVRLNVVHGESAGDAALLRCELCASSGSDRLCAPLLVSGEVIGSVLTTQQTPLDGQDRRRVTESVTLAAPVLANLRTIAVAESRAATDTLTGLPNRRALDDTLKRMVAQALRSQSPLAVLSVDLDHFKQINDRFGHDKGDQVLATVAAALRESTRAGDFVGRWGGEEFLVLAPDTPASGALALAETLRAAIERLTVIGVDRELSASFGLAACPDDAVAPELLLRQADRALYAAKRHGRNRVERAATPAATPVPAPPTPA